MNWLEVISKLNFFAGQLAGRGNTDLVLHRTRQFADYLEGEVTMRQMFETDDFQVTGPRPFINYTLESPCPDLVAPSGNRR